MPQKTALTFADYTHAESFLPWNADQHVLREHIHPIWIFNQDGAPTERFWYLCRTERGKEFILVDPERASREPAFDQPRLAAALAQATGREQQAFNLPFETIELVESPAGWNLNFQVGSQAWQCDLNSYHCTAAGPVPAPALEIVSPDGKWAVFCKGFNLWLRSTSGGEAAALTEDGQEYYDYAGTLDSNMTTITNRRSGRQFPPSVLWSPDSKKLLTHRIDQRMLKDIYLLQHVPEDGSARPKLYPYRYQLKEDPESPLLELILIDIERRQPIKLDCPPLYPFVFSLIDKNWAWWSQDASRLYFIDDPRDGGVLKLYAADPVTGHTRLVIHEISDSRAEPNLWLAGRPIAYELDGGKEIVWFSERDGWGHIYLFDSLTGQVKKQITAGNWAIRDVALFAAEQRTVFLLAGGREPGQDPYYRHLYRVDIDSSEIQNLTPEVGDHYTLFSPSGQYFVDRCGRADGPTVTSLRRANGELVCPLETGDFSHFLKQGWHFPEPFQFTGRDGVTDLYGTILHPTHFDPNLKYPVLDDIYGWNQMIHVLKSYPDGGYEIYDFWLPQALAELGFIVVLMDGMGTPYRSKAFHDVSYHNQADGGLEDHILGLRKLAAERPYIDLSRVGIYGHSGGGFNTARALLKYPDFFHVGVSSAGPHDMRLYLPNPDESEAEYQKMDNSALAANLRGKLLLMQGELDDNVHPASTYKLVNALIEANADFDMLIQPNRNHNSCMDPYYVRRLWDYFVTHLAGQTPPTGYRITNPGSEFMSLVEVILPAETQD